MGKIDSTNSEQLDFNRLGEAYFDCASVLAQAGSFKYALRGQGKPYKTFIVETAPDRNGNSSGYVDVYLGSAVNGSPWRTIEIGGGRSGPVPAVDFVTLVPRAGTVGTVSITLSTEIWGSYFRRPATATYFPLEDLTDVVISSPVAGQVLTWNGTDWVNEAGYSPTNYDALVEGTTGVTQFWPMSDSGAPTNPANKVGSGVLTTADVSYGWAPLDQNGESSALITAVTGAGITAPNSLLPNLTTGPWSIEFVIATPGTGAGAVIAQQTLFNPDHNVYAELFTSGGGGELGLYAGSNNGLWGTIADGSKKHIAFVFSATGPTAVVYLNGMFYCEAGVTNTFSTGQTMGIGCHPTSGNPMQGRIGKIAIYNVALSIAQLQARVAALGL